MMDARLGGSVDMLFNEVFGYEVFGYELYILYCDVLVRFSLRRASGSPSGFN